MKATIVKMLMPIAAFALASAGAVGTKVSESQKTASGLIPGFIHATMPCEPSISCKESGTFVCQTNITTGPQVYGKDANPGCAVILWRP